MSAVLRSQACDLSAVIPTRDVEERVGHLVRALASHLRALGRSFEILAVDERSADDTLAVLALLLREVPELVVIPDVEPGRGYARGARVARGRALLLCEPTNETATRAAWSALSFCLSRFEQGAELVVLHRRYAIARRARAWSVCSSLRGHGAELQAELVQRSRAAGLVVLEPGPRPVRPQVEPATTRATPARGAAGALSVLRAAIRGAYQGAGKAP